MPVHKCSNEKYRIGSGECIYNSKAKAESAYKAYLVKKHKGEITLELEGLKGMNLELNKIKELIKNDNK